MKKVLFLIGTLNGGGAEKVLVDTVNSLDGDKYQITVQTIINEGVYKNSLAPHIRYKTIIPFKKKSFLRSAMIKFLFKVFGCSFVYNFFVNDNYDYEISFLEGLSTKIISKSTNKKSKKYAWLHTDINCNPDSYRAFGTKEKEALAYTFFDKIFCVSESVKLSLQRSYEIEEKKLHVLYNIVDDEAIAAKAQENVTIPTNVRPIFITAGRIVKVKGYDRLLRVHHRLINEGFQHSLLIIGDGCEKSKLVDYINKNNLQSTALLLGFQSNPYKYFSKSDLFICSSYAEGYSTVVSEAVLCGIPVLSTDVAGANEPAESPRCSLVVANDEKSIYEALKNLLSTPKALQYLRNDMQAKRIFLTKEYLVRRFEKDVFGCIEKQ